MAKENEITDAAFSRLVTQRMKEKGIYNNYSYNGTFRPKRRYADDEEPDYDEYIPDDPTMDESVENMLGISCLESVDDGYIEF